MRSHRTTWCCQVDPGDVVPQNSGLEKLVKKRKAVWGDGLVHPNGRHVNTTIDIIEVLVKDEMISVEESSENTDVNPHFVLHQKVLGEQVSYIHKECGKCFDQNEDFYQHQRINN